MSFSPTFIFFGGKGGVGKTTCAAARAVAARQGGERVLIVSTDPAHSLGDALGVRLSSRVRRVAGPRTRSGKTHRAAAALDAVELDAPRAFARWLESHGRALGEIIEHGTWLDREDIDALLGLSIPGIDELVGLIEIGRLADARQTTRSPYDLVVIDTAPTGHTLRLLAAPDAVATVAAVLDGLQREHRIVRQQLARVGRPEAADRLIAAIAEQARETGARLRDASQSMCCWVLLPEELSVAESEDGLAALDRARIRVAEVIVNRVTPDGPPCPICDRRRADEHRVLSQIPRRLGSTRALRVVPAEAREPRGIAALARIGKRLIADMGPARAVHAPLKLRATVDAQLKLRATYAGRRATYAGRRFSGASHGSSPPERIAAFQGATLLLFAGKGGVGKTTCAAAAAVRLARADSRGRVLLLSTDPAHSLGDVFGVPIGDGARSIPGAPQNLRVRELDAPAALAARRTRLEAALTEIASALGAGRIGGGRGVSELIDLAPPGIDELLGMLSVAELADRGADLDRPGAARGRASSAPTVVVVDMAPTGHALRLLEMPEAARDWVNLLMRVLLKYHALVPPGSLAAELVDLSKSIRRLQQQLRDPARTRFVVVTRASEVPRLETERLLRRLRRMKLPTPAVVVNALTLAPGRCPRCRAAAGAERVERLALARACRPRDCAIILTPLAAPPPRGVAALDAWAERWSVAQI